MISQKEIIRKYPKLGNDYKDIDITNRVNCYACTNWKICGHITKTKLKETIKLRNKPAFIDHVLMGGLLSRKIVHSTKLSNEK